MRMVITSTLSTLLGALDGKNKYWMLSKVGIKVIITELQLVKRMHYKGEFKKMTLM